MVEAFDILRVNANPARFDPRKCEAINASHIRLLGTEELTAALVPYFVTAGLVADPPTPEQHALLAAVTPLVQERIQTLSEAVGLVAFLFVGDDDLVVEDGLLTRRRRAGPRRGRATRWPGWRRSTRRRSRRRCGRRWSTGSGSSRGTRSARSGPRSPAARSRRRCSSRWSCSAGSRPWPGSPPPPPGSGRPSAAAR